MRLFTYAAILLVGSTAAGCLQVKETFKNAKEKSASQLDAGGDKVKCQDNLLRINGAKMRWAEDNKQADGAMPSEKDIVNADKGYLSAMPTCPAGGTYTIGAIGTHPSCSLSTRTDFAHVYPPQ
ncbi:hypothetical protein BH09SUM1_BH09SUM1_32180 [soil metagenome]